MRKFLKWFGVIAGGLVVVAKRRSGHHFQGVTLADDECFLVKYVALLPLNGAGFNAGVAGLNAGVWVRQFGTSGDDFARGVAVDSSGNVYAAGMTAGGLDGSNAGSNDLFVVKYNSSGTKQWTKQLGTSSHDYASGVAVDSSDNLYVSGYTAGGLDGNTSAGGDDLFVVKYNSAGVKQ